VEKTPSRSSSGHIRPILAVVLGISLILSVVVSISGVGQNAYADKDDDKHKSKHSDKAQKRWERFVEKSGKEKHRENVDRHDTNYTLTARGTALPTDSDGKSTGAQVSLVLSTWISTKRLVSMDIIEGTAKIGDKEFEIYAGHAFYVTHPGRLLVFAFIVSDDGKQISLLKLRAKTPNGGSLPDSESDPPLQLDILSSQSKLSSGYSLDMEGQLKFNGDDDGKPNTPPRKGAEIVTSADKHGSKFSGALQVVISDKNVSDDEITVKIETKDEDGNDSDSITIPNTKAGSKKFEFFLVHVDTDCDDGSCVEKPLSSGSIDDDQVVTFGDGGELDTGDEKVSFNIIYGDKKKTVEYNEAKGSIELDRKTYGSDSIVHLYIVDQDGNLDPTGVDSFAVNDEDVDELFSLQDVELPDDIKFTETGNNTARFEAVLQIADQDTNAESELVIDGGGPFVIELLDISDYRDLESTENGQDEIASASFSIVNADGSIAKGTGDMTFASELKLTIKDGDQNKDSQKADVLEDALTVEIDGGDSETFDLRETAANSGEFVISGNAQLLKLTFTDDPDDDNGVLEFAANDIGSDIIATYSDPLGKDGGDEDIELELQLATKEGSVELPSSVDIDGELAVTLNDADLNDDAKAKETYTFTLAGDEAVPLKKGGADLENFAAIQVTFNDDVTDFDAITYTLTETGENTGVFKVAMDVEDLAESADLDDSLEDGDTIEVIYLDNMEEPDEEDSDSASLDQ
jgi:hypothetical protein